MVIVSGVWPSGAGVLVSALVALADGEKSSHSGTGGSNTARLSLDLGGCPVF